MKPVLKKATHLFLLALIMFLLMACNASVPEDQENPQEPPPPENVLENTLYTLMENSAPLDEITEAWISALEGAEDQARDRMTARWVDYAKYRTIELSRAFYSNDGASTNGFYQVYETVFQRNWDPSKIQDIENSQIRSYFETLDASFMRIVEYGEYVGPGFDYTRLAALESLTPGFRQFFELSAHYYDFLQESVLTGQIPYTAYSDYLIKFENARASTTSPFLISLQEPMLRWSYGVFFFGTMGSGPFNHETKSLDPIFSERLESAVKTYPDSGLAELAGKILTLSEDPDTMEQRYYDTVQHFRRFGFDSPKGIRTLYQFQHPTYYESFPEFFNFENPQVMMTLTDNLSRIREDLKAKVLWGANPEGSYNLGFFLEFANDRWASFQISASSYDVETGTNLNVNEAAVFDLTTGERVTLGTFLGDHSGEQVALIEAMTIQQARQYMDLPEQVPLTLSQNFSLGEDYLLMMLPPQSLAPEQTYDLFIDVRYGMLFPKVDLRSRLLP